MEIVVVNNFQSIYLCIGHSFQPVLAGSIAARIGMDANMKFAAPMLGDVFARRPVLRIRGSATMI